jgi:hypothetical protein
MMKIFLLSLLFIVSAFAQDFNSSQMQSIQENLIKNGGFESGKSSHTLANGTFTTEGTVVFKGNKSLKVVASAQTPSVIQDSTLYANQLADGVQGVIKARVKSNVALNLCARKAGTTSTVDCVAISNEDKWGFYQVPTIFGATSNGYSIAASGSISGTFYIDEVKVEASDLKETVNIIGPWTPYTPVFTGMGTVTLNSFLYRQVGDSIEVQGTVTTGTVTAVHGSMTLPNSYTINTAKISIANTTSTAGMEIGSYTVDPVASILGKVVTATGTSSSLVYFGTNTTGTAKLTPEFPTNNIGSNRAMSINFKLPIFQLAGSASIYSSQCGANCEDQFSAKVNTSGDAVTKENVDWINGSCSNATVGVSVCVPNSGIFTVTPNCTCTSQSDGECDFVETSSTASALFFQNETSGGASAENTITISCQKQGVDFVASRTIVGSFKEVDVSPGIDSSKTCHYVFGGAGSLSAPTLCASSPCTEYYDSCNAIAAPTRGSTGIYSVTIADGTFAPSSFLDCQCEPGAPSNNCTSGMSGGIFASTAGGGKLMDVRNALSAGGSDGTATDAVVHLRCKGQAP